MPANLLSMFGIRAERLLKASGMGYTRRAAGRGRLLRLAARTPAREHAG